LDNYYITIFACFGYLGLILVAVIFITILGGCVLRAAGDSPHVKEWAFIAIVSTFSILALSLTGNSIIYQPVGFYYALILGLGALTWKEELDSNRVTGIVVAIRKLLRRPLRKLGVNA
jgi:hypothetical protein